MLEAMLTGRKPLPPSDKPVLGFDYNKGVSTGSTLTLGGNQAADVVTYGDKGAGYAKGLSLYNKSISVTPVSALSFMETENFTVEFWVYIDPGPAGYTTFLTIEYDSGRTFPIRIADSGFGNRLQFSLYAAILGANWSTPINRTTFSGGWHHVAVIRENGKARIYYDGQLQPLASGTGSSYGSDPVDVSSYALKAITKLSIGGNAYNVYIPEFAIWIGAKYNANFTPKKGSLVA